MGRGRVPVEAIELSEADRRELEGLARRRGSFCWRPREWRTRGLLPAWVRTPSRWARGAAGLPNGVSTDRMTSPALVRRDGSAMRPIIETIRLNLEGTPSNATHWSLRSMFRATGYAPSTIHRIWRAFGLQSHRSETFKLSADPLFVEKVRNIVGLYLHPPDRALVLCSAGGEKSQFQALDRAQPLLPMRLGQAERRTHDYKRC